MNENFDLLEIKASKTPFELNQPLTSELIQSKHESVRDKPCQDDTICYTIDSNDSSSFIATQNLVQSVSIEPTKTSNEKLKRKHPIENNNSNFEFTPLKYDVTNIMYKEPRISVNVLVKKVKNILIENEINQKLFGKALLNCAESTISLLLSRPKDWNLLSRRGKNPYYKMYLWLKDPNGLNKLTTWIQNYKKISRMSKRKHLKIDDDDDLNEPIEFLSPCESPIISTISNNSTKSNDNFINLNEIQLHEPVPENPFLQHQHQMPLQPVPCHSSSSYLSGAASFRPPIQFNNPDHAQLHKIALNQSIQHVPVHQIHQQPIPTLHHSIQTTQSNSTVLTQSTPSYITSRPYSYNGMGIITNNNHLYGISQEQSVKLENYHKVNPYPTNDALIHLSQLFNININSLIHWFRSRNSVVSNMPASYNSFCNCHTCLSGASFTSYSK